MIQLEDGKKSALAGIYDSAGIQVIFDIMEAACIESENEFIGTVPGNNQQIVAGHAVMHAQRAFFQKVVQHVDYIVAEQRGQDKKDNYAKRK